MDEARGAIDWPAAYARLESIRKALAAVGDLPPEEVRRILNARARAFARPLEEARSAAEALEVVVLSLSVERYGIETAHVLEVFRSPELTALPCVPPHFPGVVNHRGRILPVLDLRRLFDLAGEEITAGSRVVAVAAGGLTFGILADSVGGIVRITADELAPPPATLGADRQASIRGVTGEMIAVLNLEALVRDPRITVSDEIQ